VGRGDTSLVGERRALLDPEPVLLVDHHQAEVVELDRLLEQGMGADHDAGLTGDRVEQGTALARRRQRTGDERNPGGFVVAAEHAALGHRAEHGDDRPVVLLREHLGRREQCRLPTGVDDLQHRAQRDHRLAGPDLALEQPVHRRGATQVDRDLVADLTLPVGQLERQGCVEALEQSRTPPRTRHRFEGLQMGAALREHGLQDEGLVVLQSASGGVPLLAAVGGVQAAERLVERHQPLALADVGGQRVGDRAQRVERELDGVHDHFRRKLRAGRVDREPPADRAVADGVLELVEVVPTPEDLAGRMGELALAVEDRHLAAEQGDGARLELVLPPVLSEEGADQVAFAVGDGDLGAGGHPAATLRPELLVDHALGLGQDGHVLVEEQVAEVREPPAVLESSGVVLEQVADGGDVEDVAEQLGRLVTDDAAHWCREVSCRTHHSTPMSSG
jgi:hypothetical protein